MLLGEGRGFEIAQGRLGPGRIHHCMRLIGVAERALEADVQARARARRLRQAPRRADVTLERIAESRIEIDQARLLVLNAAWMMDTVGNKAARQEIAMIKVAVPNMALRRDRPRDPTRTAAAASARTSRSPSAWAHSRTLRFADGPDEVHRNQIGRLELRKYS